MELYYSNYCEASKKLSQVFKQYPQLRNQFELKCIDKYYYQYKRLPDGVRGTPTIFKEENDRIRAYEGNSVFDLLKSMVRGTTSTGIPVGGASVSVNPTGGPPIGQGQAMKRGNEPEPDKGSKITGAEKSSGSGVSISALTTTADWFDASKLPEDEKTAQNTVNPFAINVRDAHNASKIDEVGSKSMLAQMEDARKKSEDLFKSKMSSNPRPNPFSEPVRR